MSKAPTQTSVDVREHILEVGQRIMAGKGFSAVGLNEILAAANVPKGSFYHYFGSKDAYGEALLDTYFTAYHAEMDALLARTDVPGATSLLQYFESWQANQSFLDCQGKCLAVKLAAEVVDLSEPMRLAMRQGTSGIITRTASMLERGAADGSLKFEGSAMEMSDILYQQWVGASLMVKITRTITPFETAMVVTRRLLNLPE